ncbi:MAG: hypothetical protein Q9168_007756 [Polycauliona sp. 1 TL-2023]
MADRPLTRNATSRKTPQPSNLPPSDNLPRRTTRVTRSQSRDVSDSDADQMRQRRNGVKPKRSNSLHEEQSTLKGRQTKRSAEPSRSVKPLPDVTEVSESPRVQYPVLPQESHHEGAGADKIPGVTSRDIDETPKTTRRDSGFSGTTVRTSMSAQESSREIAGELMENLDDLSDASDKVLGLLLSKDISEASIREVMGKYSNPKSKERSKLDRYSSTFQDCHDIYDDALFIDVTSTIRKTTGLPKQTPLQLKPWRMDPVFYKANLTAIIRSLLAQTNDNFGEAIGLIDRDFPRPFAQRFVDKTKLDDAPDSSALLKETFDVALELRTCSFMENARLLVDRPNFDPDSIVQQVFYKDGNMLAGWDVSGMQSKDLTKTPELRDAIIARIEQLRKTFSETESPFIDLGSLDRSFSHSRLLARVALWSATSVADAVQSALNADDSHPFNDPSGGVGRSAPSGQPSFNSPGVFRRNIDALKAREATRRASKNQQQLLKQATAAATATPAPTTARPQNLPPASAPPRVQTQDAPASHHEWQQAEIDSGEEFNNERGSPDMAERIMQTQERINAESNKENVAVQTGTQTVESSRPNPRRKAPLFPTRVAFDSQESDSGRDTNARNLPSHHPQTEAGRSRSEISDDEAFQSDTRPRLPREQNLNARQGRANIGAEGQRLPKRARTDREGRKVVGNGDLGSTSRRHNSADAANAPPAPSQAEAYRLANRKAKQRVALAGKKPQTRKPWSAEETEKLWELVSEYGTSWALLKDLDDEQDKVLKNRDQVAIRDKARNMKFDYLKELDGEDGEDEDDE